jgi:hypothetical protein
MEKSRVLALLRKSRWSTWEAASRAASSTPSAGVGGAHSIVYVASGCAGSVMVVTFWVLFYLLVGTINPV